MAGLSGAFVSLLELNQFFAEPRGTFLISLPLSCAVKEKEGGVVCVILEHFNLS